jgi:hypothetical protein
VRALDADLVQAARAGAERDRAECLAGRDLGRMIGLPSSSA